MQGMLRSRFVVPIVLLGALWSGCTDQIAIGGEKLTGGGGDGSDGIAGAAPTEPGGLAGAAPTEPGGVAGAAPTEPGGVAGAAPTEPGGLAGAAPTEPGGLAGAAPTEPGGAAGAAATGRVCDPSLYYYCIGEDGCYGQKPCLESADGYGACECFAPDGPVATDYSWSDETGTQAAPAEVPIIIPSPPYPRYPGDGCPTRPDIIEATDQPAKQTCGEQSGCAYGSCWWFCDCADSSWYCAVLLC